MCVCVHRFGLANVINGFVVDRRGVVELVTCQGTGEIGEREKTQDSGVVLKERETKEEIGEKER